MKSFTTRQRIFTFIRLSFLILIIYLVGRGVWLNYFKKPVVVNNKFDFEVKEVSREAGIDYVHSSWTLPDKRIDTILPWLTSLGASASVVDINNDGWQDIYLIESNQFVNNRLYVNQKNGTFVESADEYGLGSLNNDSITIRAIFFDADNDGVKEMLRFSNLCPALYKKGNDKKYIRVDFLREGAGCTLSHAINIFDYDNDGLLDIVYAGIMSKSGYADFVLPTNLVLSENGASTFVIHNLGNFKFEEVKLISRQDMKLFTTAVGLGDLKGNFKQDIWFATLFHHDQVFLKEEVGYSFTDDNIEPSLSKTGMAVEIGYIDHKLLPHLLVTHVYKSGYAPHGNSLYHYNGDKFKDYAADFGISNCGWAWGAKFFDINNDGELDLYIANGMISLPDEQGKSNNDFWFKYTTINASNPFAVLNLNWRPTMQGKTFSGDEKDCLFLNKNGKYTDVASRNDLNIDVDNLDGRSVALVDYMNNGSQSLLVSNQKQRTYLYNVAQRNTNRWLGIKLIGTMSNRDAIGAKVLLYRDGQPLLIRENQPYNGFATQSDDRLHFGLGDYDGEVTLEIHWPSGRIQKQRISKLDTYIQILEE